MHYGMRSSTIKIILSKKKKLKRKSTESNTEHEWKFFEYKIRFRMDEFYIYFYYSFYWSDLQVKYAQVQPNYSPILAIYSKRCMRNDKHQNFSSWLYSLYIFCEF